MTLQHIQKLEYERVCSLSKSLNRNSTDFKSMVEILSTAEGFDVDTVKHIKAALDCYCRESRNEDKT